MVTTKWTCSVDANKNATLTCTLTNDDQQAYVIFPDGDELRSTTCGAPCSMLTGQ